MPEGPEVRTIVDQLTTAVRGHDLVAVTILSGRYERHDDPRGIARFREMAPMQCHFVGCKGKFIYFYMANADRARIIWNTLGMTGRWSRKQEDHARVRFTFDHGDFYFCDARNFGTLAFDHTPVELQEKLTSLGIDLLQERSTPSVFKSTLMRRKRKTIVETLMDQSVTAGVGNYIKCEALYRCGISPHRVTGTLSDAELEGLQDAITHVMASSYAAKGHTMSDYRDLEGDMGSYRFSLAVYNQVEDPHGNMVVREETPDGRTTHWVPAVQR